jgi:hypothetical protein
MYVNAKMISVETVLGIRGGGMKERGIRVNSSMIYLIHYKNLVNTKCILTKHNNGGKKKPTFLVSSGKNVKQMNSGRKKTCQFKS